MHYLNRKQKERIFLTPFSLRYHSVDSKKRVSRNDLNNLVPCTLLQTKFKKGHVHFLGGGRGVTSDPASAGNLSCRTGQPQKFTNPAASRRPAGRSGFAFSIAAFGEIAFILDIPPVSLVFKVALKPFTPKKCLRIVILIIPKNVVLPLNLPTHHFHSFLLKITIKYKKIILYCLYCYNQIEYIISYTILS